MMIMIIIIILVISLFASNTHTLEYPYTQCATGLWTPSPGTTWYWELANPATTKMVDSYPAQVYDFDMFSLSVDVVKYIHGLGRVLICYIDTAYEPGRPDSHNFTSSVLGNDLKGWPGQKWVDIRSKVVRDIMFGRAKLAYSKGCDAIEWDDVDSYTNDPGFDLTPEDQINFNTYLATITHQLHMSAGLKNDLDQVKSLVSHFEFAINEQCYAMEECDLLQPFLNMSKAVFTCEYSGTRSTVCPIVNQMNLSTIFATDDLSGTVHQCCTYASPSCRGAPSICSSTSTTGGNTSSSPGIVLTCYSLLLLFVVWLVCFFV